MKSLFSLLAILFAVNYSYAQSQVITTGNNVINSSNPYAADIVIGSEANGAGARHDGSIMWWNGNSASRISNTGDVFYLSQWSTTNPNIGLAAAVGGTSYFQGNLGIGTNAPQSNLEIKGSTIYDASTILRLTNNSSNYGRTNLVLTGRIQDQNDAWQFGTNARNAIVFAENAATTNQNIGSIGAEKYSVQLEGNSNSLGFLSVQNGNTPNMVLTQGGNLGLGTGNPQEKLVVNGTIHSKEIKVDTNIPTPDYVFDSDYKLPTLTEVKDYIAKNHHLSEIPSAAQMKKDGLKLGEMNTLLLKKVEELTLHLIEKEEQVNDQSKKLTEQQKRMDQQKLQLEALTQSLDAVIKEIHKN